MSTFPVYGVNNSTKPFVSGEKLMDTKKFEKLMDLVINEDHEAARELFHDICVEKSREIFESVMYEEMEEDMDEGMGGQVGDLLDEINAEESGMTEEEEGDLEFDDEESVEFGGDEEDFGDEEGDEVEDAVIRIEDKLDQLMAEFEARLGDEEGEEDFGGEEEMEFGDEGDEEEMMEADEDEDMDESDASVMEAIALKKVSVTHGDNGAYTKSPNTNNSGQAGMDSHPVKFSGDSEAVPTAPKAPSNFYSKGETSVKGEAAPKPKHGDDGANAKSPVAESRRSARRPIR